MNPANLPLGRIGTNVSIHPSAILFNPEKLYLGSNVRIDCFCVLSAGEEGIHIGDHVHLAAGAYIFGSGGKVVMEDFSGLSSHVAIYTASDDYSEGYLTNPTVPEKYKKVARGPVVLRKHVIIGSGSVLMPGVELGIGAAVGALSFVYKNVREFQIVTGNPIRVVGTRGQRLLELEKEFLGDPQRGGESP
jgi:dTDP-4-amino-4,6-dideoxy-D-glucose acyltransferase